MESPGSFLDGHPRRCFGATVHVDETDDGSNRLGRAVDALNNQIASAIADARGKIVTDRGRGALYTHTRSTFIAPYSGAIAPAGGVSLLEDCGLPGVNRFGSFFDDLLANQLSPGTVPFLGCARTTLATLWNPTGLSQVVGIGFGGLADYYGQLHFLTRANPEDEIWRGAGPRSWFNTFGAGLTGYMTELFSDRFVDRNGTHVRFDLGATAAEPARLDPKQTAPQLGGAIVSTLVEYLGDELFKVPFYSREILSCYRDYRGQRSSQGKTITDLNKLTGAAQSGTLSEADAELVLGIPKGAGDLAVVFDSLVARGKETPVVASAAARMVLRRIDQLDFEYTDAIRAIASHRAALDSIEDGTSVLKKKFTCFKSGVIPDSLQCLFVTDNRPDKQGVSGRDNDTGQSRGDRTDYADLVGRLVSFGGTAAEKSVRSLAGGLIRGVAIASLQNDVIAEIVASLAGTLAKKLVESVTYQAFRKYIVDESSVDADTKRTVLDLLTQIHGLEKS